MTDTVVGANLEVRITFGNPIWRGLKSAGFRWDRFRKCYVAPNRESYRTALNALRAESEAFEREASNQNWLPLYHRKSYDAREFLKRLGGRWNQNTKAWCFPSQEKLQQARKVCDDLEQGVYPQEEERRQTSQLELYTEAKRPPVLKDGIFALGEPPDLEFWRAVKDPESHAFSGRTEVDHYTGARITSGHVWVVVAEEVTGKEREQLLA